MNFEAKNVKPLVLQALFDVAPDLEGTTIGDDDPIRQSYELDSADFLNFIVRLHKILGVDIPEADYPRVNSISQAVAYLSTRLMGDIPGKS